MAAIDDFAYETFDHETGEFTLVTPHRRDVDFLPAKGTLEGRAVRKLVMATKAIIDLVHRGAPTHEEPLLRVTLPALELAAEWGLERCDFQRIEQMKTIAQIVERAVGPYSRAKPESVAEQQDHAAWLAIRRRESRGEANWTIAQIEDDIGVPRKTLSSRRHRKFGEILRARRAVKTDRQTGRLPKTGRRPKT